MSEESYLYIQDVIEESVQRAKNEVMFHEVNACPDFWEQTRIVAKINVAVPLLKCAKSVEGWSVYQKMREHPI